MGKFIDMTGKRYGRLVVVERVFKKPKRIHWKCKCDCGNEVIVDGHCLRSGHTTSCGCYQRQRAVEANTKHGMKHSQIYKAWCNIKNRCYNKNNIRYYAYGGRGIKVCDKWQTFEGFYEDMGSSYKEGLTLDRIDVNGNYCKENCRWATTEEQANNKTTNHLLTYNGETDTMKNMAKKHNLTYSALKHRIQRGWEVGKALTTPQRNLKHSK